MTRQETIKVLAILSTAYPKMLGPDANDTADLWADLFADIPFDIVKTAVQKYILTAQYQPSIAAIRQMCVEIANGESMSWEKAYLEFQTAVSRFGRYRIEEMMSSLSPQTRQTVQCMGVDSMLNEDVEDGSGTLRAQFRDVYKNVSERENKYAALPDKLKTLISGIKLIGDKN